MIAHRPPAEDWGVAARSSPCPGTVVLRSLVTRASLTTLPSFVTRPASLALQGATLVALLGGGAAWSATDKAVHLRVDGQDRLVHTHAATVGSLLADHGLAAGEHDLVLPAAGTALHDGQQVDLHRGRQLQLVVDGAPRSVWVTADSVDEALDQVGLGDDRAALSTSPTSSIPLTGMSVDVRLPKPVTVLVDGGRQTVTTTAATVGAVLDQAGVTLRPQDRTSVPVESTVTGPLTVRVARVDTKHVRQTTDVAYDTTTRKDGSLYRGQRKVLRAGHTGTLTRTYDVITVDGSKPVRHLVSSARTSAPVNRVVAVGTKSRPATQVSSGSSTAASGAGSGAGSGLNWSALARCESGGDPHSVSGSGTYRGLYQFSYGTWRSVGGSGDPAQASSAEQTSRARILYGREGRSPWPVCGKYL